MCIRDRSTANVKHPMEQGISGMLGVFVDTIVVCSCTAFIILSTGALDSGKEGIALTQYALSLVMGRSGSVLILVAMFLFGFTSLLSDIQVGEINLGWVCKKNPAVIKMYRVLACALVVIGAVIPTALLWVLVDILTAFMVLVNIIPLIGLSGQIAGVIRDYERQKEQNVEDPVWTGK